MSKWPMVKLSEIASICAGQGAPQGEDNYSNEGLPFIRAGHLIDLIGGVSESSLPKINEKVARKYNLKIQPKDTIVFAKSGMSCMKGYVHQLRNDCYVVSHLACIYPKKIHAGYLRRYFEVYRPNRLIKDEAYPSILLSDISNMLVPLPPLEEQKRIAAVLDKVQSLIDLRKKQIAEMDMLVKAKFIEMFGDPISNEKGWETDKLSKVCPVNKYKGRVESKNGKVWLLNLDMVESNTGKVLDYVYEDESKVGTSTIKFDTNCVLYSKLRPYLNKVVVPAKSGYATSEIISLQADNVDKYFLSTLLMMQSFVDFANSTSYGAKMPRASVEMIKNFDLILPPDDLQREFRHFCEQVAKLKMAKQKALEQMETLYKALMQQVFS